VPVGHFQESFRLVSRKRIVLSPQRAQGFALVSGLNHVEGRREENVWRVSHGESVPRDRGHHEYGL
jgi:hypothetical protein